MIWRAVAELFSMAHHLLRISAAARLNLEHGALWSASRPLARVYGGRWLNELSFYVAGTRRRPSSECVRSRGCHPPRPDSTRGTVRAFVTSETMPAPGKRPSPIFVHLPRWYAHGQPRVLVPTSIWWSTIRLDGLRKRHERTIRLHDFTGDFNDALNIAGI